MSVELLYRLLDDSERLEHIFNGSGEINLISQKKLRHVVIMILSSKIFIKLTTRQIISSIVLSWYLTWDFSAAVIQIVLGDELVSISKLMLICDRILCKSSFFQIFLVIFILKLNSRFNRSKIEDKLMTWGLNIYLVTSLSFPVRF